MWFPYSFTLLGGFTKTALMLIFVDLVLGPLLVFIVFKEGKKYLNFDINVLLGIQILAFIFGAYSLFLKHPAYAVFTGDRFTLTNVSEIYPYQPWHKSLGRLFLTLPKLVVAKLPENDAEKSRLILDVVLRQKPDIDKRPEYYQALEENLQHVLSKSLKVHTVFNDEMSKQKLNDFIKKQGGNVTDYAFFPLSGNNKKDVVWVFNRTPFTPAGIIEINPWLQQSRTNTGIY